MNTSVQQNEPVQMSEEKVARAASIGSPAASRARAVSLLAIPVAASVVLAFHLSVSKNQPLPETHSYSVFLGIILGSAGVAAVAQSFWSHLRRWMRHMCPIIAAAVWLLCFWEVITSGLRWLPLPYFPPPSGVLQSLMDDRALLFDRDRKSVV